MNVASSKLCDELQELSGWHSPIDCRCGAACLNNHYDLGYLLRKLPYITLTNHGFGQKIYWCVVDTLYDQKAKGDTPEDAVAKLAIDLFKQGILTKQGVGNGNNPQN